ncbi:MAG TPA: membrane or secreted protein [Flavobacteriales bacterium]|nr:membrane or secreted protein [Flavobacteriales bacterium]
MEWKVILLSIGLIGIAFAGIAIKLLLKKDGEFAGTCASNNPLFQDESGSCSVCGARPSEQCLNEDEASKKA